MTTAEALLQAAAAAVNEAETQASKLRQRIPLVPTLPSANFLAYSEALLAAFEAQQVALEKVIALVHPTMPMSLVMTLQGCGAQLGRARADLKLCRFTFAVVMAERIPNMTAVHS